MDNSWQRQRIAMLASAMGPLKEECVLTGGAMVSFYLSDPQELAPRVTLDVDLIINVDTRQDFVERVERLLRAQGFHQGNVEGDPICRWRIGDVICDVMPTDASILGFVNEWYLPGFLRAEVIDITADCVWKTLPAVYFLATKLSAFFGRGIAEPDCSQDLEDIVSLVNGRPELLDEAEASEAELRVFLTEAFMRILQDDDILECVPGHLAPDPASQQRLGLVLARMRTLAGLGTGG